MRLDQRLLRFPRWILKISHMKNCGTEILPVFQRTDSPLVHILRAQEAHKIPKKLQELSCDPSYVSKWAHSFTRLFTILRAVLWSKIDLFDLLDRYGTAKGNFRNLARPDQAYFPGFL